LKGAVELDPVKSTSFACVRKSIAVCWAFAIIANATGRTIINGLRMLFPFADIMTSIPFATVSIKSFAMQQTARRHDFPDAPHF
jgi:hypothetical protein